ncbi:MAG: ribosomal subunit interface protein [Bacillales bacterium]|jgi:ribosomal subunit interface protein|nr:ribosomal subunit interface protein [Bacillales bacterium]
MKYNIRGENIEITPAIREYAEKKIGRLERYLELNENSKVNINMRTFHDHTAKVEVTIVLQHLVLRAEEHTSDMYEAIDLITDKLERQIRKHKTKVNRKWRESGKEAQFAAVLPESSVSVQEDDELEVVRTKQFNLKPMDIEEAILQMDLLGHNFFVFADGETDETQVVYKRNDGKYGLIQVN